MFGIPAEGWIIAGLGMIIGGMWHISRQLDKVIDLLGSILLK